MAYGLPFGPDAGQAGIRALVTVASLKTSEGSGKTQTQCLFLQTEKGSCLYSAGKPVSGGSAASSVVGGWLKGKSGAKGCREIPVRQRDQGPTSVSESRTNNVRVRSGRRWRKSCKAASKEKKDVNRDSQQRWREDPDAEVTLDERQEEEHNGCVEGKQLPNPLHVRRVRQEKEEVLQSPICFHDVSANGCIECGRKAQRGESPTRSTSNRQNSETHPQRKDGEEKRVICELETSVFQVFSSDPDLETNKLQSESNRNSDITKFTHAKSEEELNSQNDGYSGKEDTDPEVIKAYANQSSEQVRRDLALSCNPGENLINEERTEEGVMSLDGTEEKEKITQISAEVLVVSGCSEDGSVCNPPLYIRDDLSPIDTPLEGSIHNVLSEDLVQSDQESGTQCLQECEQGLAEHQIRGKEELNIDKFDQQEQNSAAVQDNTVTKSVEPLLFSDSNQSSSLQEDSSDSTEAILKTERADTATNSHNNTDTTACCGKVLQIAPEEKEDNHREGPDKVGEDGVMWRGRTPDKLNVSSGRGNDVGEYAIYDLEENGIQEDNAKDVTEHCDLQDNWRSPVRAEQCRINEETPDTCGQTSRNKVGANSEISANVSHAAYTDLSTSLTLSRANPAHFLPLLDSMTTDLPLLEVKREEEGERVGLLLREESQEGKSGPRRELEEPGEEKRGCSVASKQESKDEEEEEDDEFGTFMQAEGESAWSEGLTMPASVPCRSRESVGECCGF